MSENPFEAPPIVVEGPHAGSMSVGDDRIALALGQTKPWVRFLSVLTILGGSLGLLLSAGTIIMGATGPDASFIMGMGFGYLIMSCLYLIPGILLWRYASRSADFLRDRSTGNLATALEAQRSFWRFSGIAVLVIMILYAGILVLAAVVGFMSATRM